MGAGVLLLILTLEVSSEAIARHALESRDPVTQRSRDPTLRTKPLPPQPTEPLVPALFASRLSQLCSLI
jgi:hypothetical protein